MAVTSKYRLLFVAVTVALLAFWYVWDWSQIPRTQPPLTLLSGSNLDQFKQAFNGATDRDRLVLLLSPT